MRYEIIHIIIQGVRYEITYEVFNGGVFRKVEGSQKKCECREEKNEPPT